MTTNTEDAIKIGRFARACGFQDDADHRHALGAFLTRLRALPLSARKLLAHVAELAYREHHDARKPGAAYLPELHETCGLGVDEMYAMLRQLEQARFLRIENEYPFQDVVFNDVDVSGTRWPVMRDLFQFSQSEQVPLRDFVVDLRTDNMA